MTLSRRLMAECIGTMFLVAAVVGSGLMAERLTEDDALALLANALPTGAMLIVLITVLGPISGAHLNPAVTAAFALEGKIAPREAALYAAAQIAGGVIGTMLAHLMFEEPVVQIASTARTGSSLWLAEAIAAFGLVSLILACLRFENRSLPTMVGLYITAAYWFTASTSFANPAVTIARCLTDSFAGIRPLDVPAFIVMQFLGALLARPSINWLVPAERQASD